MIKALLKILVSTGLGIVGGVLEGWVLTKLWAWSLVPHFGLEALPLLPAVGICVIAGLICGSSAHYKEDEDEKPEAKWGRIITYCLLRPFILLGMAWILFYLVK